MSDRKRSRGGFRDKNRRLRFKQELYIQQNGLCYWCHGLMYLVLCYYRKSQPQDDHATFEHLIPKSKGGTNSLSNIVLSHCKCNKERGNEI